MFAIAVTYEITGIITCYIIFIMHLLYWRWIAFYPEVFLLFSYNKILLLLFKRKFSYEMLLYKTLCVKLIQHLSSQNVKELCNLGNFFKNVFEKSPRVSLLSFPTDLFIYGYVYLICFVHELYRCWLLKQYNNIRQWNTT